MNLIKYFRWEGGCGWNSLFHFFYLFCINFNIFHPKYWLPQEIGIALGELYGPYTVEITESYLPENILCLIFGTTTPIPGVQFKWEQRVFE